MNTDHVLVTGAAGFIGSHIVRELANWPNLHVVALDDLSGGYRENIPEGVSFAHGSVTDPSLIRELFEKYRFRYVYHLAAYAAEGLSHFIRRFNYTNNLIGSVNLINEAVLHGTESFVFTSSIAVYGAGQTPMREDMTPLPEDPYGISKYAVELDLKCAHEMFGLNHVIFRPHNVYGEYQNIADKYRNVVGIFMNQILSGQPMSIFGDGEQQRAFSYVGDIAGPIVRSAWTKDAQNRTFNIGADTPYSVNDLARAVACALGVPAHPVNHLAERKEVKIAFSDHSLARQILGADAHTDLDQGIRKMAEWVKSAGMRTPAKFENIEVSINLPDSWRQ